MTKFKIYYLAKWNHFHQIRFINVNHTLRVKNVHKICDKIKSSVSVPFFSCSTSYRELFQVDLECIHHFDISLQEDGIEM